MSPLWKSSVLIVLLFFGGGSHPRVLAIGGSALVALAEEISDKNDMDENGGVRGAVVTEEMNRESVTMMQVTAIECEKMSGGGSSRDQVQLLINGKVKPIKYFHQDISLGYPEMKAGDVYTIPKEYMKHTKVTLGDKPNICLEKNLGCVDFGKVTVPFGRSRVHFTSTSESSSYYLHVTVTEKVMYLKCRWTGCKWGGCRYHEHEIRSVSCGSIFKPNDEYCCYYT